MRVVFFGDSLTEGVDGASYLRILSARLAEDDRFGGVELFNAGVGGDTAIHLARRLARDVVPLAPDWVIVFIGVNDCSTALLSHALPTPHTLSSRRYFREVKALHEPVTPDRFTDALRIVVDSLVERCGAKVALCTPAIYGETPNSHPWRLLDRYAEAVRWVGAERNCPVIDVRAAITAKLATWPPRSALAPLLGLRAYFADTHDIETVARHRRFRLTYDCVHLTTAGAEVVADTIYDWLMSVTSRDSALAPLP